MKFRWYDAINSPTGLCFHAYKPSYHKSLGGWLTYKREDGTGWAMQLRYSYSRIASQDKRSLVSLKRLFYHFHKMTPESIARIRQMEQEIYDTKHLGVVDEAAPKIRIGEAKFAEDWYDRAEKRFQRLKKQFEAKKQEGWNSPEG